MTDLALANRPSMTSSTLLGQVVARIRRHRDMSVTRQRLLGLDDRMLRDIGLSRHDVMGSRFSR